MMGGIALIDKNKIKKPLPALRRGLCLESCLPMFSNMKNLSSMQVFYILSFSCALICITYRPVS